MFFLRRTVRAYRKAKRRLRRRLEPQHKRVQRGLAARCEEYRKSHEEWRTSGFGEELRRRTQRKLAAIFKYAKANWQNGNQRLICDILRQYQIPGGRRFKTLRRT